MTERPSTPIPAGWYPDPRGAPQRRWWDGTAWTHALETPPTPVAAPAYANLPGPVVNRTPSPSAPTVKRAISAEETRPFPTRRQLRDAAATLEMQRQLSESAAETVAPAAAFAVGAAGSLRAASAGSERTAPVEPTTPAPARAQPAAPRVVSTAAAASLSEAPVHSTGSAISATTTPTGAAYSPTHTFTPAAAPTAAARVAAAPAMPAPVAATAAPVQPAPPEQPAQPVQPAPPVQPALPVYAAPDTVPPVAEGTKTAAPPASPAPAASAPAATTPAPRRDPSAPSTFTLLGPAASQPFVPVMRSGSPNPPIPEPGEITYQPFGMTPSIRTGVMERPTTTYTAAAWVVAVLPALVAGAIVLLDMSAPELSTPFALGGLGVVLVVLSVVLALVDRRALASSGHTRTASPAWALLTPPPYLLARAVRTRQQSGRGWAPFVVSVLVAAAVAASVVLGVLPVAALLTA